jgi:hypothetical protein
LAATPLPSSVATATPLPSASATATPIAAESGGSAGPASIGPMSRGPLTKPFLASEALIEDLAPLEPAGSSARLWCGALGVGFLVFGAMTLAGVGSGGALEAAPEIVLGIIAVLAALVRLTYRQRAMMMVLLGLLSAIAGLRGFAGGQGWGLLRTLTAIVLPGALLFRARYRAYAPARWILGIAVVLSLPFVTMSVLHAAQTQLGLSQSGAVIAVVAVGASLLGFMGSETTGGGTATALGVVIALAIDLALRGVGAPDAKLTLTSAASIVASSAVFAGTSAMASLGLFQLLAWRLAADARRINLHAERKEQKRKTLPSSDWSTKE